tara:strand:+ start:2219 stop:2506 length:288 start_codon:yes stop_codon:yes gene_type:complete
MRLNLKSPIFFPESTLKEIKELVEANNHNDAVFVLAEVLQNKKSVKIMIHLSAICEVYGETPEALISIRNEVLTELLQIATDYYDSDISELRNAF